MLNQFHFEEFLDNREMHMDYYTVMEQYNETELLYEILHFMDLAFPEWKSNKGIGTWAGEFVLSIIENNEYLDDREEYTFKEMLTNLYIELADRYSDMQVEYSFAFDDRLISQFNIDKEFELKEKEHLPFEEYSVFYDKLFFEYKSEKLGYVTYNFRDDLIY